MKLHYLPFFVILYLVPKVSFADPIDRVAELIRQGNIHELAKLFAANVEVTIPGGETVSNPQAELILDKFFNENKPKSVKVLHKINSNANYRLGVLIMNTNKGAFRVAFTLKQNGGSSIIIEFRIEPETVK